MKKLLVVFAMSFFLVLAGFTPAMAGGTCCGKNGKAFCVSAQGQTGMKCCASGAEGCANCCGTTKADCLKCCTGKTKGCKACCDPTGKDAKKACFQMKEKVE